MDTYKRIIVGFALTATCIGLFYWIGGVYVNRSVKSYTYIPAGVSFEYQPNIILREESFGPDSLIVTLQPENKNKGTQSENDPLMQCVFFARSKNELLTEWIKSLGYASLFGRIIDGTTYPSADVQDKSAIGFKTDGLYASDHVAFEHNNYLVDCSVEYISLDDPLRMYFTTFLTGITFI